MEALLTWLLWHNQSPLVSIHLSTSQLTLIINASPCHAPPTSSLMMFLPTVCVLGNFSQYAFGSQTLPFLFYFTKSKGKQPNKPKCSFPTNADKGVCHWETAQLPRWEILLQSRQLLSMPEQTGADFIDATEVK